MYYSPFVLTQEVVNASSTLSEADVGRFAVLIKGNIHFLAQPGEDGQVIDRDGQLWWRVGEEIMMYSQYMRRTGQWPI